MVDQPKNTHENGCCNKWTVRKNPVQNAADLKKPYNYEKSDVARFSAFLFFCVQERRTRDDPKNCTKIMLWKKNEAKGQKARQNKFPEKNQKNGKTPKKIPNLRQGATLLRYVSKFMFFSILPSMMSYHSQFPQKNKKGDPCGHFALGFSSGGYL